MNRIVSGMTSQVEATEEAYGLSTTVAVTIAAAPAVLTFLYALLLTLRVTRPLAEQLLGENYPVEIVTFLAMLGAGVLGLRLAWAARGQAEGRLVSGFYLVFSCGILLTAMEEISWGQAFVGFGTPAFLKALNAQGESNFHNIHGLQGGAEVFRGVYGLGGIVGVWLCYRPRFRKVGSPLILLPWFLIVALFAALDFCIEHFHVHSSLAWLILTLAEVMELLVGISALLFIWLNARMFSRLWRSPE